MLWTNPQNRKNKRLALTIRAFPQPNYVHGIYVIYFPNYEPEITHAQPIQMVLCWRTCSEPNHGTRRKHKVEDQLRNREKYRVKRKMGTTLPTAYDNIKGWFHPKTNPVWWGASNYHYQDRFKIFSSSDKRNREALFCSCVQWHHRKRTGDSENALWRSFY